MLTLTGNGFTNATTIKLDDSECQVQEYTIYSITCITSEYVETTTNIDLKYSKILKRKKKNIIKANFYQLK